MLIEKVLPVFTPEELQSCEVGSLPLAVKSELKTGGRPHCGSARFMMVQNMTLPFEVSSPYTARGVLIISELAVLVVMEPFAAAQGFSPQRNKLRRFLVDRKQGLPRAGI